MSMHFVDAAAEIQLFALQRMGWEDLLQLGRLPQPPFNKNQSPTSCQPQAVDKQAHTSPHLQPEVLLEVFAALGLSSERAISIADHGCRVGIEVQCNAQGQVTFLDLSAPRRTCGASPAMNS